METNSSLIIMTTAIIRPDLHLESIGQFYSKYYIPYKETIKNKIIHIINIDSPEKLKNKFTLEQTIENFNKIIPNEIKKIFITPSTPSFLNAFKNIMKEIDLNDLVKSSNIFWWFEDDWVGTKQINLFSIINLLKKTESPQALTLTSNSQLGSFRGGPIMNCSFFTKYFNIEKLGHMNMTCDPERQVSRYIGAKSSIKFNNEDFIRQINNKDGELIELIQINMNINKISPDFGISYYKNKFNSNIKFKYHIMYTEDFKTFNHNLYNENDDITKILSNSSKVNFNELEKIFEPNSIKYYIIKPYCFEDCGRKYAEKHNLIKGWKKIGDPLTYS